MAKTRLFIDWINVGKGRMEATFDPARLSEEGKVIIEKNKKDWGIHPDMSGHGMKRSRLPYGIKITVEKARKSKPWLFPDKPWEKWLLWPTVIHENGKYRCWYSVAFPKAIIGDDSEEKVFHEGREIDMGKYGMCYAESEDGHTWFKPSLGIFSYDGSKDNNIVSIWQHESGVFRDESAHPNERYKCFIWDRVSMNGPDYGLYGAVSPDGYKWSRITEPLIKQFCDTQNIAYWDSEKKKYIGYFRGGQGLMGGRAIAYAETDDFRKWPKLEIILHPGALDAPCDDYYTNGFTLYPNDPDVKMIFSSIYHHDNDQVDVRMATTHNGKAFNWISYDSIVDAGKPGEWDCGCVYISPNMVFLQDCILALPYHGMKITHNEFYGDFYENYRDNLGNFAWAIWDEGRLAGIEADSHGEFWTRSDVFEGDKIEINARTTKVGSVEAEIWECVTGFVAKPVEGYTFEECIPFRGDEIWTSLKWKGKKDSSELKGKNIQLRIRLSNAKIFGYRLV